MGVKSAKKLIILAVAAILIFFGVARAYKGAQTRSVVTVLDQNAQAALAAQQIRTIGRHSVTNFNAQQFVTELSRIDSSRCPKKFQLAWLDYVQACERAAEQTPSAMFGEAYLSVLGVVSRSSSLANLGARPLEAAEALQRTWQQVERAALEYNVRIEH